MVSIDFSLSRRKKKQPYCGFIKMAYGYRDNDLFFLKIMDESKGDIRKIIETASLHISK